MKRDLLPEATPVDRVPDELAEELYARHVEVKALTDLIGTEHQRGTPIPALYNVFYKFIQNPSTVSVETFRRMVETDETVGSGVDFLSSCLAARIGVYQHKSDEITQWVTAALERIEGGWYNAQKELLSAAWAGFSVAEKVWANREDGFVIERLATLPPSTILFEVDRLGRITDDGILQYQRNYNPQLLGPGFGFIGALNSGLGWTARPDALAKFGDLPYPMRSANTFNYLSLRIPRIKCVHISWDSQGRFGNPYGRSLLRRAYNWWVQKWAYCQMLSVALDRKGTPLTVVYADPNVTLKDPAAVGVSNNLAGKRVGINAQKAAQEAFRNIHNDTTVILPGKKGQVFDTDFVPQDSNGDVFLGAIQHADRAILRALLIPPLVFTNGDGTGSYSLGQEHARTFEKILDGYLEGFKRQLIDQIVHHLIAYNFPRSAWQRDGFGDFAKRELTGDERNKEAEMVEKAVNMGAVDLNDLDDLNKTREIFGFAPRDEPLEETEHVGTEGQSEPDGPGSEERETDEEDARGAGAESQRPAGP